MRKCPRLGETLMDPIVPEDRFSWSTDTRTGRAAPSIGVHRNSVSARQN